MFSMDLPYFADPEALPSRLPTKEEMESSKDVLKDRGDYKVVGVGPHFVVKYGKGIHPTEGLNILFVQQNTSVPVPRVYAIYTDVSEGKTYIVMERMSGDTLQSLWPELSEAEKAVISVKLRGSMLELRALPSPGYYCGVGNRGLMDEIFCTRDYSSVGPFDTEDELNAAMLAEYVSTNTRTLHLPMYERLFPRVFHDHPPTFTHGDFQQKNILVRKRDGRPLDDLEVVLIDWEFSGWYPSYWEFSKAMYACHHCDTDWNLWLETILDEYLLEFPLAKLIFLSLSIGG